MFLPKCRLWTAADRIGDWHLLTDLLLYSLNHPFRIDIEEAVIACTMSAYDADVMVRKILCLLEDFGQSRRRLSIPVVKNPTLLKWVNGRNPESPIKRFRGDSDVIRYPTAIAIGMDHSVRETC
jgi:hypothetical protein